MRRPTDRTMQLLEAASVALAELLTESSAAELPEYERDHLGEALGIIDGLHATYMYDMTEPV